MESDKEESDKKEEENSEEELRRKIREKCASCSKGHVCMIDWDHRVLCKGPAKK